jgi:cytochrome c oxidase subunit 1
MLFCIGFVSNFIIGGITGVFLAAVPVNLLLHDTYYVVGHFHYIVMGVIGFGLFGAFYYWFPLVTGKMYQRKLGKWHFWLSMVGTNVAFLAMLLLGYLGMPRRYARYELAPFAPQELITILHQVTTFGAFLIGIGAVIFLVNVVQSYFDAPALGDADPWDLDRTNQATREWQWFRRRRQLTDGGAETDAVRDDDSTD